MKAFYPAVSSAIALILFLFATSSLALGQTGWVDDGTVVRLQTTTDNVGIGTNSPTSKLQVLDGNSRFGAAANYGQLSSSGNLQFFGTARYFVSPNTHAFKASGSDIGLYFNAIGNRLEFQDASGNRMFSADIAGSTPGNGYFDRDLNVVGTVNAATFVGDGSGLTGLPTGLWTTSGSNIYYNSGNIGIGTSGPKGAVHTVTSGTVPNFVAAGGSNSDFVVPDGQSIEIGHFDGVSTFTERLRVDPGGNLGIGTSTPTSLLDVAGTLSAEGFRLIDGASEGYVLTSDASGTASWQELSTGVADTDWTIVSGGGFNPNNMYSAVLGNVGIGTTSIAAKLNVNTSLADGILDANDVASFKTFWFDGIGPLDSAEVHILKWDPISSSFNLFELSHKGHPQFTITDAGNTGIGTADPSFRLSLGATTGNTKLALYETGPDNSYGLGVMPGTFRFHLNSSGARFAFFDSDSTNANEIFTVEGNGKTRVQVLEITGGSDLAEPFDISGTSTITPGMVVSINPDQPGQLRVANTPYDRTVAGIVSGAGGIKAGMLMGQSDSDADGEHPVALSGRVYCNADASNGPIEPGDLLTTSNKPGYAMKATDYEKAQGAVLGKAITSLSEGRGLVLVLVSLQ